MPQFEQIGHRQMDWNQFTSGVYLFTLGMVKKVLVADTFGKAVNWGYSNVSGLTGVDSVLLILFYVLQLYFDFSGYCNMARGLGWLFGIEIPVNFNSPYKAVDIVDFWKRWHITLSRFFTKYVYIPLGGKPEGQGTYVWQPVHDLSAQRNLAWRRMDLCIMECDTGGFIYSDPYVAAV